MKTYQIHHRVVGPVYFKASSYAAALVVARRLGSTVVMQFSKGN